MALVTPTTALNRRFLSGHLPGRRPAQLHQGTSRPSTDLVAQLRGRWCRAMCRLLALERTPPRFHHAPAVSTSSGTLGLDPRVSSSSGRHQRRSGHDVAEREGLDSQPVRVRSGETPASSVAKPPASVESRGRSGEALVAQQVAVTAGHGYRSDARSEVCSESSWARTACGRGTAQSRAAGGLLPARQLVGEVRRHRPLRARTGRDHAQQEACALWVQRVRPLHWDWLGNLGIHRLTATVRDPAARA
jgi:hypothetical protein